MHIDTRDAICVRQNGQWWEAIAGDKSAGEIIRNSFDLVDLIEWLRRTYPSEPLVVLPR